MPGTKRKGSFLYQEQNKRRGSMRRRAGYPVNYNNMRKGWQSNRGNKTAGTLLIPRSYSPYGVGSPLKDRMDVQLMYSEQISLTSNAGVPTHYTFRLNSIFDPNYTGVGHQPRGHDELALMYHKYCVRAAAIDIVALPNYQSGTSGKFTALVNNQTTVSSISQLYDMEEHTQRVIPVYTIGNSATTFGTNYSNRYTYYIRLKDLYEVKDVMDDNDAQANFGSNPVKTAMIHLCQQNVNAAECIQLYQVTIRYYCTVLKPNTLAAS